MTDPRPWTFVVSEYLDLPFLLRKAGELVVSVRSAREAMDCLDSWHPARIIIDAECTGADEVLQYARRVYPDSRIELQDQVINQMLAS